VYKDENGHIVVETVGTFIPLVLLMISILSLVNIVAVAARIHFALTQTALTLSVYSYLLKDVDMPDTGARLSDIDSVFNGISKMTAGNTANNSDSLSVIEQVVEIAKGEVTGLVIDGLIRPVVERNLANGSISGKEFKNRFGVTNMDLRSSVFLDSDKNIKLTAQYDVDYTFGALPLPFGPKLRVTQTVITKAWQGGSGAGVSAAGGMEPDRCW